MQTKQIINTMWSQISLSTKMACGVRELIYGKDAKNIPFLTMRVGSSHKKLYVKVSYMPNDLYRVEYIKINRKTLEMTTLHGFDDVYCEMLSELIYDLVHNKVAA